MKRHFGSVCMMVGIALCGYFIYLGISKYSEKDRCVEVRGLSEREVLANRVTWPMSIFVKNADLQGLYDELSEKKDSLVAYLKQNGVKKEEIDISIPSTNDTWAGLDEKAKKKQPRYTGSIDVSVRSRNVEMVRELMQKQLELLKKGVDVTTREWDVEYEFDDLASLKPEMVEEATKNAREVAEKFAKDADCSLGSLINATQGLFTIDTQYSRPQYKQIRVTTNMSYFLK